MTEISSNLFGKKKSNDIEPIVHFYTLNSAQSRGSSKRGSENVTCHPYFPPELSAKSQAWHSESLLPRHLNVHRVTEVDSKAECS